MNVATEIIVSWVLTNIGVADDDAARLIAVLYEGSDAGEADALRMVEDFVMQAESLPKAPPYDFLIAEAVRLHRELEGLKVAGDAIEKMIAIDELLGKLNENVFAQRIIARRVADIVRK